MNKIYLNLLDLRNTVEYDEPNLNNNPLLFNKSEDANKNNQIIKDKLGNVAKPNESNACVKNLQKNNINYDR